VARVAPKQAPGQAAPPDLLLPLAVFCLSVGSMVSYLVLRSSWRGLRLAGVLFAATYGISTVSTQVESLFFLSAKMPPGLIRALFAQGAIAMALFASLTVLILGKWRAAPTVIEANEAPPLKAVAMTWRILLLVVAFVFLYLFFGYYVAWKNPALRASLMPESVARSHFWETLWFNLTFGALMAWRYGHQQGALRGPNPRKHGRPSHHPLMAV